MKQHLSIICTSTTGLNSFMLRFLDIKFRKRLFEKSKHSSNNLKNISKHRNTDRAQKMTKKVEITIIMGDSNVRVNKGRHVDIVVVFDLKDRKERGERLIGF